MLVNSIKLNAAARTCMWMRPDVRGGTAGEACLGTPVLSRVTVSPTAANSQVSANIDAAIVVLAMHGEPCGQVQAERAEMVLGGRRSVDSGVPFCDAEPLLAHAVTGCIQQCARDAVAPLTWLHQEADDGTHVLGVRCRLIIQRVKKVAWRCVATGNRRAIRICEVALHGPSLDALACKCAVLACRAFRPFDHGMILVEALAVAG